MTYTPEMRAADAEIAKAMGWTEVHAYQKTYYGMVPPSWKSKSLQWKARTIPGFHFDPDLELDFRHEIPHFHDNPAARDALLEWLAADEARWDSFIFQFYLAGPEGLRAAFLATPAQVAEAALKVIKEME